MSEALPRQSLVVRDDVYFLFVAGLRFFQGLSGSLNGWCHLRGPCTKSDGFETS